ncbi:hypothetical protein N7466_004877 [Penicillium verhagenii]|uniref:uncharacterized protein n=1 Tax=Penicillium verhagenii TaxID=1562060 RepID=UPI0025458993|nr:uncharacterized protein N7466_004877 [Penicillium verhagenii]KAJ5935330.1 hypothetical protein N7466_004877 [Penicillium verhagenii]
MRPRTEASVRRSIEKKRRYRERFKLRKTMSQSSSAQRFLSSAQKQSSSAQEEPSSAQEQPSSAQEQPSSAQEQPSSTQGRSSSAHIPRKSDQWTEVKRRCYSDSATIPESPTEQQSPTSSTASEVTCCSPNNFPSHKQRVRTPPRPATPSIDINSDTSMKIFDPHKTQSYQALLPVDATAAASQSSSAYHPGNMPSNINATAAGRAGYRKAPNGTTENNKAPNGENNDKAPSEAKKKPTCQLIVTSTDLGKSVKPKIPDFGEDLSSHGVQCSKLDCDKRCAAWDSLVSICPACGPFSTTRYCSKEHLREDVKQHWSVCGERTFATPVKKSSFPKELFDGPPMIPFIDSWSSPERHRQAMWFSTGQNEGDYFVFTDLQVAQKAGVASGHYTTRCQPTISHRIRFDNANDRDIFRRCLAVCLFASFQVPGLVNFTYRMIRDNFRSCGQWTEALENALYDQFFREFNVEFSDCERHACMTEWTGYPEAFCRDPVCLIERETQFSSFDNGAGRGYERLCQWMEAQYWILRANRFTHPTCHSVDDRIVGVGYNGWVAPMDRRPFRRGEGWDGVGTGPMEIEYVRLGPRGYEKETIG